MRAASGSPGIRWTPALVRDGAPVLAGEVIGIRPDIVADRPRSETRRLVTWGCALLVLLFGGFGLWSATVPLTSAVIAPGIVKVLSKRRAVQHLEGGIVKAILVREGNRVERGQVVARLDTTQVEGTLGVLETKLFADLATEARLDAEKAGASTVSFPDELRAQSARPEAQAAMQTQLAEFAARAVSLEGQRKVIDEQVRQLEDAIRGLASSSQGLEQQLAYLNDEIRDSEFLLAKGLARKPRLLALKRAAAEAAAQIQTNAASVAQSRGKIAELEERRRQLVYGWLEDISRQRHAVRQEIADLRHRITVARDMFVRSELKAPEGGIVVGLNASNLHATLAPRETLLEIVPVEDRLIVEGEVRPADRDEVYPGQPARIRVLAFNSRRAPMLTGTVTTVSADALLEPKSGKLFYRVEVELQRSLELAPYLGSLQPGMPVEVFIETGQRTFSEYLLKPLMLRIDRAFRES
ncbi:HlyD family type I secretion periplasmic adaptor subunit [Chelatococcus sp. SYSU_G07232]|uniref:Membrane fusion protein (MFP) family protein n=1 Tax=Chelatococcus albus TaxID=3047466 RepID=A0ABT7AKJ6_9HYPH|nr:HlyD family type I secretion periplasmic adaptor subunit [Chelatococcus sp. SYSU_G07232]MDJ1159887.1 HlyD family type I secretion periplasmic adaptor subunit [Chelatococcus sp. SYSU_G07232]